MATQLVYRGKIFEIFAWKDKNSCQVIEFLADLDEKDKKDAKRLVYLIQRTADEGIIKNEQQSRLLEDGIYEFKAPNTSRILYFFDRNHIIVCTQGFRGKQGKGKTPKNEIEKAQKIKDEYFKGKSNIE